ncbi:hypothetical protein [Streptomyces venezuelae]
MTSAPPSPIDDRSTVGSLTRRAMGEAGTGIALLALVAVFTLAAPKFATTGNFTTSPPRSPSTRCWRWA